jgi:3-oxoacyl-[acyl-carrier-protein] synthase-1
MTITTGLVVTGVGALTPVGLSAAASFAALRAGVSGLGEIETHSVDGALFDKVPVVGGRVPTEWFSGGPVQWEWPSHERMGVAAPPAPERMVAAGPTRLIELALPAATEAWTQAVPSGVVNGTVGLYMGIDYADESERLMAEVGTALGVRLHAIGGASAGRSAGLVALDGAAQALLAGSVQIAIVGAVDSQIRTSALEQLEEKGLLRSGTNPQGIIPGEASAFLVLERVASATQRGAKPLAWLTSCAVYKEPSVGSDDPNQGVGLSNALAAARYEGGIEAAPLVICDLNGDRYRAMEWGLASLRTLGDIHGNIDIWHPADCTGDVGAASGVLNVAWGVTALQKGYARAERVLVWGASDGRSRAAAVLAPVTS